MSGPTLTEIIGVIGAIFPYEEAETWDNCGLQIGDPNMTISRIAVALDPLPETVDFCVRNSCDLLITHHPLFLDSLRSITPETCAGAACLAAARNNINILSLHTNVDACNGGLNDYLCSLMGLRNVETPLMARCARIANLEKRMSSLELMEMVGASLNIGNIRVVGDNDGEISRVFVAAGSGMSYFQDALAGAVHAIITGDVKYHPAREALYKGVTIIDAGHFGLEKHFKDLVAQRLTNGLSKSGFAIECVICDCEMDPFGAAIV